MKQLEAAVQWHTRWQTSMPDWDTEHSQKKGYENRNYVIQRWLKRIKPYRHGKGK